MPTQSKTQAGDVFGTGEGPVAKGGAKCACCCPACGERVHAAAIERYGKHELFACAGCGLQFWNPREMPDARWYERMYRRRDQKILPLEPGHRYFLSDALVPRGGELLDIGCGTGNFLAAAQRAGYRVTGTELDRNAARFAKERMGLKRVLPLTISEFVKQSAGKQFDVVTFFEVLEHQTEPVSSEGKSLPEAARNGGAQCAKPRAVADRAGCSGLSDAHYQSAGQNMTVLFGMKS